VSSHDLLQSDSFVSYLLYSMIDISYLQSTSAIASTPTIAYRISITCVATFADPSLLSEDGTAHGTLAYSKSGYKSIRFISIIGVRTKEDSFIILSISSHHVLDDKDHGPIISCEPRS